MSEHFRLLLALSPSLLLIAAILIAAVPRHDQPLPQRLLDWMLLLPVGVQAVLLGLFQVFAPEIPASLVGWRTSPFQFQIGMADVAIGLVAIDSFQRSLAFKSAVVGYAAIYYAGTALGHVPQMLQARTFPLGHFELGLAITLAKAITLPILLWWCWSIQTLLDTRRAGSGGRI